MLTSTAFVLLMILGLAFFYAGMVKNAVSTLYQNFIPLGVIGVLWAIIGYSFTFSGSSSFIGDTSYAYAQWRWSSAFRWVNYSHLLFMAFQMMFAIITPALITGAFAECVKFKVWLAILVLWSLVVYSPVAYWVWASTGWLF